ncbi:MAG TPA: hypothetical protein VGP53_10545 [Acidimicrobiales bacterium]|nr:hypothetical protein [Acidimicrobiales bacterium]
MTPKPRGVPALAGAIALLLIGSVTGIARADETSVGLTAGSGPSRPGATDSPGDVDLGVLPVDLSVTVTAPPAPITTVTTAPVPTTTARTPSTATPPGPSTPSGTSGRPAGGDHRDRPRGPGEVGSVEDLGPGPVESTVPAPCTPSSQSTPTHGIAVIELAQGCVRALVPAGGWVGTEVSWNPEGTWLVATVKGRVVRLARDGSWRQDLGGGGQVSSVVLSPDGRRMAVLGQMAVSVLDQEPVVVLSAADGTGARVLGGRFLSAPSWSPDSQVVALMSNVGGVEVPDIVHIVSSEGRELARRTFTDRALWGTPPVGPGTMTFRSGPAPLGPPTFLPDGRLFLPAFIELPSWPRRPRARPVGH